MITRTIRAGQGQLVLISPGRQERASPAAATGPRRPRRRPARPAPRRSRTGHPPLRRGQDRGDGIRPRRPGRPGQHRIGRKIPTPPGEHRTDRLDPFGEAPQPAPHRLRRPAQQRRDQPVSGTGRLRGQPRPDHRGGVRPADQQQHREQHMRDAAAGAPRPPRNDPQPAVGVADPPAPRMAPPGQHTRAPRTRQPARAEPLLDRDRVGLYREHRASERNHTALPQRPGQGHSGRAVAYPDPKIVTVAAPTTQVNATRPPQAHPHAQRRRSSPTSSSPEAVNTRRLHRRRPGLTTRRSNRSPDCSLASPQAIQPR